MRNSQGVIGNWVAAGNPDFIVQETGQEPTVTAEAATLITSTSARLWGRIQNTGGSAILERRLEWGRSGEWSGFTAGVTVSGSEFYYDLPGLSSDTRYQFRAWTRNSAGWGMSGAAFFTTTDVRPPTVSVTTPSGPVTVPNGTTSYGFSGSASAPQSTVAAVQWRVNGGSWNTASGTTAWNFTVSDLALGQNVVDCDRAIPTGRTVPLPRGRSHGRAPAVHTLTATHIELLTTINRIPGCSTSANALLM